MRAPSNHDLVQIVTSHRFKNCLIDMIQYCLYINLYVAVLQQPSFEYVKLVTDDGWHGDTFLSA